MKDILKYAYTIYIIIMLMACAWISGAIWEAEKIYSTYKVESKP